MLMRMTNITMTNELNASTYIWILIAVTALFKCGKQNKSDDLMNYNEVQEDNINTLVRMRNIKMMTDEMTASISP